MVINKLLRILGAWTFLIILLVIVTLAGEIFPIIFFLGILVILGAIILAMIVTFSELV